jgi:hypothetical protein
MILKNWARPARFAVEPRPYGKSNDVENPHASTAWWGTPGRADMFNDVENPHVNTTCGAPGAVRICEKVWRFRERRT